MLARVLTAAVGLPILLAAVWWGAPWLTLLVLAAAVLGIREFYSLVSSHSSSVSSGRPPFLLGAAWMAALVLGAHAASGHENFLVVSGGILAAGGFATLLWFIAFYNGKWAPQSLAYSLAGGIFVGFLLTHALALRELVLPEPLGRNFLLFAMLVTFATDTGAFLTGRSVGKHPMAPRISPNKTWEGSAGGMAGAVAAALVLGQILYLGIPVWQQALLGIAVGVAAQAGDLLESKFKRISNVKDAGGILPGHGGILDRMDSVVVSIPTVYYLVVMVLKP